MTSNFVVLQIASPACTELEVVMLDWLGKMLELPKEFLASSGGRGGGVIQVNVNLLLDFKLSPCFECLMLSSGLFPGVCNLNANVSEHCVCSPMKMEQTECFETLVFKLQTPVNTRL
jgi:hypothetical protein